MTRALLSILLVAFLVAAPAADAKPRERATSTWHDADDWSFCDGPYDACHATSTADPPGRLTAAASFASDTSGLPSVDAVPVANAMGGLTTSVKVPRGTTEMRVALHFVVDSAEAVVDEPGTTGARAGVGGNVTCSGCHQVTEFVDVALAPDHLAPVGDKDASETVEVTFTAPAGETLPARVYVRAIAAAVAGPTTLLWEVSDDGPARVWPAVGASHSSVVARVSGFDVTFVPAPTP